MADAEVREAVAMVLPLPETWTRSGFLVLALKIWEETGGSVCGYRDPLTSLDTCWAVWLMLSEVQRMELSLSALDPGGDTEYINFWDDLLDRPDAARVLATAFAEVV